MRSKFNAAELSAIESGHFQVRDGRTWYEARALDKMDRDSLGKTRLRVGEPGRQEVGKGTMYAYPGHVRAMP